MAWSGDIFQQNLSEKSDLKFVIPKEGATIWTDNLMIPKTAENPVDAIMLMDYFYQPDTAAKLAENINYVTPGAGRPGTSSQADAAKATGEDKKTLQAVADSPLVFPSEADYAKLRHYRGLTTATREGVQRHLPAHHAGLIDAADGVLAPYVLILPGGLWLRCSSSCRWW